MYFIICIAYFRRTLFENCEVNIFYNIFNTIDFTIKNVIKNYRILT